MLIVTLIEDMRQLVAESRDAEPPFGIKTLLERVSVKHGDISVSVREQPVEKELESVVKLFVKQVEAATNAIKNYSSVHQHSKQTPAFIIDQHLLDGEENDLAPLPALLLKSAILEPPTAVSGSAHTVLRSLSSLDHPSCNL